MTDLSPRRDADGKAEWHIIYHCDLECVACNRASFLRQAHTDPMTVDDARVFCDQARGLGWRPRIVIVGGEPALHPDLEQFVVVAREFSGEAPQIFSNGYSPRTQQRLTMLRGPASVCGDSHKPAGSVTGPSEAFPAWYDDMFVSPADLGHPVRPACWMHCSGICGVSVDHEGYSPCSLGGALDALLHLGARTKRLADLFDPEWMAAKTEALCRHCGAQAVTQGVMTRAEVDAQPRVFGAHMSETWRRAFEGRR